MLIVLGNLCFSLFLQVVSCVKLEIEPSGEKRLISAIVEKSTRANQLGRPVLNSDSTVHLELDLYLIQILNLNEKNQVLTTNVWLTMSWNDPAAIWKPNDYDNVTRISIDKSLLWTPDIYLYNYADERLQEQRNAMLILSHDGSINWIPTAIYKSYCRIDITDFPFDEQFCFIKLGSWTYTERQLNISFKNDSRPMNLGDYTVSNEWDLIESPGRLFVSNYFDDRYPYLIYFLLLRRKSAFTACLLVLPCVLLASLTLVIFLLPPESPAKMVLGMNIFVAFFLLLLLLADNTPQASTRVPHLGIYFCMNMMLITLSSFLTVCVINSYFRGDNTNRVPDCILRILIRIGALQPVPEFLREDLSRYSSNRRSLIRRRGQKKQQKTDEFLTKKEENLDVPQKSVVIFENFKNKERPSKPVKSAKSNSLTRRRNPDLDPDPNFIKELNKGISNHNHHAYHQLQHNNSTSNNNVANSNGNNNMNKDCCSMGFGSCFCGENIFFNSDSYLTDYQKNFVEAAGNGNFCRLCAQESYMNKLTHENTYCPHEMMNCPLCKSPNNQIMSSPPFLNGNTNYNPVINNSSYGNCKNFPNRGHNHHHSSNVPGQQKPISDWENSLKEIQTSLKDFQKKIHQKEIAARISKEWRCVATVLDRIFLAMYFIIQLLAVLFIIPRQNKKIDERVSEFTEEFFPKN